MLDGGVIKVFTPQQFLTVTNFGEYTKDKNHSRQSFELKIKLCF
jgi:hypothetical protein